MSSMSSRAAMPPGQVYQFRQGFGHGKSPLTGNPRNTIKASGRRHYQHRTRTGPNNPYISISSEDYDVTDTNFDALLEFTRNFGIEELSAESQSGWRICFPDNLEGQRLVEDCYRFLSGRRVRGQVLRLRKFDSGSPVKSSWSPTHVDHRRTHTSPLRQHPHLGHNRRMSGQQFVAPPRTEHHLESTASKLSRSEAILRTLPKSQSVVETTLDPASHQHSPNRPGTSSEPSCQNTGHTRTASTDFQKSIRISKEIPSAPSDGQITESYPEIFSNVPLPPLRGFERRRLSIGSDDMSISSGPAVSEMPSTPSITARPKCCTCKESDATDHNPLVRCACRRSYHAACHKPVIPLNPQSRIAWLCAVCTKRGRPISGNNNAVKLASVTDIPPVPRWQTSGVVAETPPDRASAPPQVMPLSYEKGGHRPENSQSSEKQTRFGHTTVPNQTPRISHMSVATTAGREEGIARNFAASASKENVKMSESTYSPRPSRATHSIELSPWLGASSAVTKSPLTCMPNVQGSAPDRLPSNHKSVSLHVQNQYNSDQAPAPSNNNYTKSITQILSDQNTSMKSMKGNAQYTTSVANSDTSSSESFAAKDRQSSTTSYEQVADTPEMMNVLPDRKVDSLSGNFMSDTDSDLSSVPEEVSSEMTSELSRPSVSFNRMITDAIADSPTGQLDGKEVLSWIKDHYAYYATIFPQKTLYSNVHALLSMGKNEGRFVKHEPPPGVRARCKYSLSQKGQHKVERKASIAETPQQQHQHQPLRPNSLLTPQASTSANSTPAPKSGIDDQDDEDMPRTAGDIGYYVKNCTTSKYRITPKNGMPEWGTLTVMKDIEHSDMKLSVGDMVKVLLENTDDGYGKIFDMRRINEDITAVAILWYISTGDLQKIISHRNRREWPEGFKYLLTNWVDVINLKAIECKADPMELQKVFQGAKIVDCSGGTRLIREASAKEVAWVMRLTPSDFHMIERGHTHKSETVAVAPHGSNSTKLLSKRKRDHSSSLNGTSGVNAGKSVEDLTTMTTHPILKPSQDLEQVNTPVRKFKKPKPSIASHADGMHNELLVVDADNDVDVHMSPVHRKSKASKSRILDRNDLDVMEQDEFTGSSSLKLTDIIAAKDAEIARLHSLLRMQNDENTAGEELPEGGNVNERSLPSTLETELQALRIESDERSRAVTDLKTVFATQSDGLQQLKNALDGSKHARVASDNSGKQILSLDVLMARGLIYDHEIPDWRSTAEKETQSVSIPPLDAPYLKSQKKKWFGKILPRWEKGRRKYGETPNEEARIALGIPENHVLCIHEGVLSYRDDTRAADGIALLNPDAIYPF